MKIRGWSIDAFGALRNYDVRELPDGVTIVHGPNEAGKSTLLWFLRGMLFGFPDGRSGLPLYVPADGGRHGGRVVLSGRDGEYVVERQIGRRRSCHVTGPAGARLDEAALRQLLGGADEHVFRTIFAFSLTELMSLQSLNANGVRERIFSAGVAGAGASARAAITRLNESALRLVRPRGQARINALLDELRGLQEQIEERQRLARTYAEHTEAERRARRCVETLGAELEALRGELARTELLDDLWPAWRDLSEARTALAALGSVGPMPDDGGDRLSAGRLSMANAERAIEELRRERADIERRRNELHVDDRARATARDVDVLAGDLALQRDRLRQMPAARRQRGDAERKLQEAIGDLGPEWDVSRIVAHDRPLPRRRDVRDWERRLEGAARELDGVRSGLAAAEERHAEGQAAQARIAAARPSVEPPVREHLEEQETVVRRLRVNVLEYRAASAELGAREAAAGAASAGATARWLSSRDGLRWAIWGLGGGVAAAICWALAQRGVPMRAGWWVVAAIAAAVVWALRPRRRAGDSDAARPNGGARESLHDLYDAVLADAAFLRLDAGTVPALAAVEECERLITRHLRERAAWDETARRLAEADQAMATLRREISSRRQVLEAGERQASVAARDWEQWKRVAGLPPSLPPAGILDFVEAFGRARECVQALRGAAEEERQLEAAVEAWEVRARGAVHAGGIDDTATLAGDDLVEAVRGLAERCARDAEVRRTLVALAAEETRLDAKMQAAEHALGQARAGQRQLFAVAGVANEEEFLARLNVVDQRRALVVRIREREAEIAERTGDGTVGHGLRAALEQSSPEEWRARRRVLADEIQERQERRDDALRRHRDAETACRTLEASTDIATLDAEREALVAEIATTVGEWRVRMLARALIEETLRDFERERQPRVLAEASRTFRAVTGGRYTRIVHGQGADLEVLGDDGRRHRVDNLSRGTAEQLYLCIRLGLVEEFSQRSVSLPIIMDDVLVNFDPVRAREVARHLAGVAERRQVLLFTCHPMTRDLMVEHAPSARVLELGARALASPREVLRESA